VQLIILKSKIHMARVTEAELEYEGSLSIDRSLMDQARILPFEKILVADLENGNRFETYAIPAPPGSGQIGLNGATTRLGSVGDRIIIFTFGVMTEDEARAHRPLVLILDEFNRPKVKPD